MGTGSKGACALLKRIMTQNVQKDGVQPLMWGVMYLLWDRTCPPTCCPYSPQSGLALRATQVGHALTSVRYRAPLQEWDATQQCL